MKGSSNPLFYAGGRYLPRFKQEIYWFPRVNIARSVYLSDSRTTSSALETRFKAPGRGDCVQVMKVLIYKPTLLLVVGSKNFRAKKVLSKW